MKATKQFIEDAIEGGWNYRGIKKDNFKAFGLGSMDSDFELHSIYNSSYLIPLERPFLDPEFWQAVGKTRGWSTGIDGRLYTSPYWKDKWHRFIDHLADGKTIEGALEAIE